MNKTVVYVGLGLLALYLLTRKKDILKSAEVKQTLPPPEIGQPVEKPKPPVEVTQMPIKTDFTDLFKGSTNQPEGCGVAGCGNWWENSKLKDDVIFM